MCLAAAWLVRAPRTTARERVWRACAPWCAHVLCVLWPWQWWGRHRCAEVAFSLCVCAGCHSAILPRRSGSRLVWSRLVWPVAGTHCNRSVCQSVLVQCDLFLCGLWQAHALQSVLPESVSVSECHCSMRSLSEATRGRFRVQPLATCVRERTGRAVWQGCYRSVEVPPSSRAKSLTRCRDALRRAELLLPTQPARFAAPESVSGALKPY